MRLFLLLAFLPAVAAAETVAIPQGCYVAYENPSVCYSVAPATTITWMEDADKNHLTEAYGQIMGVVTNVANVYKKGYADSVAAQESCAASVTQLQATIAKQAKKIRNLRKKMRR